MRYSFTFNRPLSPHILIYTTTFGLLRSILHRISGLLLAFSFYFFLLLIEMSVIWPNVFCTFFFWKKLSFFFFFFLHYLYISFFFYHFTSGFFHFYLNSVSIYDFSIKS